MANNKKVTIKLVKSPIGRQPSHKATLTGLGLRRINQMVQLEDTPSVRGMINKVKYMLEEVEAAK